MVLREAASFLAVTGMSCVSLIKIASSLKNMLNSGNFPYLCRPLKSC